jgi:hypothetical protein
MVINGTWGRHAITVSVKPNCVTVSLAGGVTVFSYDYAGRLWTGLLESVAYRRGLDGKVIAKWGLEPNRQRRWLPPEEAADIEQQGRVRMAALLEALEAGKATLEKPLTTQAEQVLERAVEFDAAVSQAEAARYHQIYKPVGILPPDQYMAVVLQATEGCSFNTCTFCDFYKQRPFRVKTPEEFRAHAEAVGSFLGAGLSLRRTIFLGDANALALPMHKLLPLFEVVQETYDVKRLGGIYAFLDGFSGDKKDKDAYRKLAERGLKRVYLGLESGNAGLLGFLKKPGKPEEAVAAVRAMKAGGVAVGVIVLLGAGGETYAAAHVQDTVKAINAMGLDAEDIIYFSELIESEGLAYTRDAYQAQLKPLTTLARQAQGDLIERMLVFSEAEGTPHISRYDIREFVY